MTDAEPGTLQGMNELVQHLDGLKAMKETQESALSEINKEIEDTQRAIIDNLQTNNLDTYRAPNGLVSISPLFTAKLPQGEDKQLLYAHMKQIGRFEDLASIHSATFNSWVKEQYDLAREEGREEPQIPGVKDVKTVLRLNFRRAR